MITASMMLETLTKRGFDFYTGVPCSFLTPLLNCVINEPELDYIGAANEGEAMSIAAGAWLAGKKTVVMMQNSGLGNATSPLTSLNHPFKIPTLMLITWRGEPSIPDEPQHQLMGQITQELLRAMGIPCLVLPDEPSGFASALDEADRTLANIQLPVALLVRKGSIEGAPLRQATNDAARTTSEVVRLIRGAPLPTRYDVLCATLEELPENAVVISTTGKCGRELYTISDRDQHLYQVGSMGFASAMALGLALNTENPVVVLDGDGAALMHLGNVTTIGAAHPKNLTHIILDNGVHDSTGGQATVSPTVDFAALTQACNYANSSTCDNVDDYRTLLRKSLAHSGPNLVHAEICPGSIQTLGRPRIQPHVVSRRLRDFLRAPGNSLAQLSGL